MKMAFLKTLTILLPAIIMISGGGVLGSGIARKLYQDELTKIQESFNNCPEDWKTKPHGKIVRFILTNPEKTDNIIGFKTQERFKNKVDGRLGYANLLLELCHPKTPAQSIVPPNTQNNHHKPIEPVIPITPTTANSKRTKVESKPTCTDWTFATKEIFYPNDGLVKETVWTRDVTRDGTTKTEKNYQHYRPSDTCR